MKIISWNIDFKSKQLENWRYLIETQKVDIALLQEVLEPPEWLGVFSVRSRTFWKPIHGRPWGSAIYVKEGKFQERDTGDYRGWIASCEVQILGIAKPLLIYSIHQNLNVSPGRWVTPHIKKMLDFLVRPVLQDDEHHVVVGGDFNAARLYDVADSINNKEYSHKGLFDWLTNDLKLFECHRKFHEQEEQTVFIKKQNHPYQNDHIFVSRSLVKSVLSCRVENREVVKDLSDHSPVIAELFL